MNMDRQKEKAVCIGSEAVRELIHDIFQNLKVSTEECSILAEILLEASLSGYEQVKIGKLPVVQVQ